MDFLTIGVREGRRGGPPEIFPDFTVVRSKDLMVRGRRFYAIWDEEANLWSRDEYDVQRLVDAELKAFADREMENGKEYSVKYLRTFSNNGWSLFQKYVQNLSDNAKELDMNLTFANTETKKEDYVSRRLPYPLEAGEINAWDELLGTLYLPEERAKIEWAIGAIVAGDAKRIQKFVVFYGPGGTGKSTVMNIINKLFEGYTTTFEAKALASNSGTFSTEVFKNNPLVAIQQDGDLSKMEDNSKLNSIISHEEISMNEKYKATYSGRVNAFLFMGTNQPVKISDAKSGIIRRLIDIIPSGDKIPPSRYFALMSQIDFELGAIAAHCLEVYRSMGKNYYNSYRPLEMMLQTDVFFNYIEACYDIFKEQDGASLKQAYSLYKEYCQETGISRVLPQYKVREELRNYFDEFKDRVVIDGQTMRSYYQGFSANKFKEVTKQDSSVFSLVLDETTSLLDLELADQPAQGARENDIGNLIPAQRWANVKTTLAELDTREVHYVKVPEQHIVIDFDIKDDNGNKSLALNLASASEWPPTYAEVSQGGNGVHLHYIYEGDVSELSNLYSEGIEIKTLLGDASLRRRLSKCNNVPIATINAGLPVKERKKMLDAQTIQSERGLRDLIGRNLRKEIHPGTKPSIDFIAKILEDAYSSGLKYDVTDLRPRILAFANNSTNQPQQSLKTVLTMKWHSEDHETKEVVPAPDRSDSRVAIFDCEVYPNLLVVCWKHEDADPKTMVTMINPTPQEVEALFSLKLVGFNNRKYDNHILYGRYLGYDNAQLYKLSKKIVSGAVDAMFGEAYGLSYADVYDYSSKKQSLKRWQIELGLRHLESDIPWDEPVPDELISKVVEYCSNDVLATEATHKARNADFVAREILADLSGLAINDTTQKHTARIVFGKERNPQAHFVYTDLSKEFPGYIFENGKSEYRGEDPSEGGYVYAEPGIHKNVALLDIESMHPTSIVNLNLFGDFTPNFEDLLKARLAIKHKEYDVARKALNGRLAPYLENTDSAKELSYALKIVINIVYGLTSASFTNAFRDVRNVDNIVAKRGALFMIDLKHFVQDMGYTVVHIKTDSIKIADATPEVIEAVHEFGSRYGYKFEHESTYEKMCLVNNAVYIAREGVAWSHTNNTWEVVKKEWTATGAQFQHPFVFKTLFSKEPIEWDDLCETKQVTRGEIYIDFDSVQKPMYKSEGPAGWTFIGRVGQFVPVTQDAGGGILWRVHDDKCYAVTGTKGYFWLPVTSGQAMSRDVNIDESYYDKLVDEASRAISKYGDLEEFLS